MARYADPTLCPDCRATLPVDPAACPRCALPLRGPAALSLLHTLQRADELLVELRAGLAATPVEDVRRVPAVDVPVLTASEPSGLRGASVPRILLGLGALCLMVAAVIFLAVAWSWLGLGGRTTVLVLATVALGGGGIVLAGRGLRVAAEALSTVALGLVALDVIGAVGAGWIGTAEGTGATLAVGVGVLAAGLALAALDQARSGVLARETTATPPLVAPQLAAAFGLALATAGMLERVDLVLVATLGALAGLGLAALGRMVDLRLLALAALADAMLWWTVLVVEGLERAVSSPTLDGLWGRGEGIGLVDAAALALLAAFAPLPRSWRPLPVVRSVAGSLGAALLTALVLLPAIEAGATVLTLTCLVGLLAAGAAAILTPSAWRAVPATVQALLALPLALVVGDLLRTSAANLAGVGDPSSRPLGVRLGETDPVTSAWLIVPAALVLAASLAVHLPRTWREPRLAALAVAGAGAVAAPVALASYAVPLWTVVATLVALGTAALLGGLRRRDLGGEVGAAVGGVLLASALPLALPSAVLTTAVLAVATALAALMLVRGRFTGAESAAEALLPLLAGSLVWSTAEVLDVAVDHRAIPVLVVVGAMALLRPRVVTEVAAALTGLAASALALLEVVGPVGALATPLAVHLTLAGALVTASALVHPSRRLLGWPGGALLAAATWVRLVDVGVTAPEAYTLPTALVLLTLGVLRLLRDPSAPSLRLLTPGLTLATLPSLLWVLGDDPVSLRALLLGAACLVLVLGGLALRWGGPVVVGAAVGAALVLRELAPYAAATPQWVLVGLAGTVLTVVGITWEQRVNDVRRASLQLSRLR